MKNTKVTTNPLEITPGQTLTIKGDRGVGIHTVTLLEKFRREFRGAEDKVAYIRMQDDTIGLAVVSDHNTSYAEYGGGWTDSLTQRKMDNLCKRFKCKTSQV
jgi:hypothetical protein